MKKDELNKETTSSPAIRPVLAGWLGGKNLLAKRIIERIPKHICYVEPFAGAAWVLFKKSESKVEVINDINKEVVTLYRCLQWHLEEFMRYFKWVLVSRDEFERLKVASPETLTDIQRSARFYYLQQACFGGRIVNPSFSCAKTAPPRLNLVRIEEYLSAVHLRLSRAYIECLPYSDIIERYDGADTFFYIDPPYFGVEDYYGKDIFRREEFAKLAEQLTGIKGKFLLSLNDTPEIRELFINFEIESVQTKYSCTKGSSIPASELLINNYGGKL